jgi:sugar O-acyltransferase (sialic acid O-acetyltransferase NeuD family)
MASRTFSIALYGAGGHARVVLSALKASGATVAGVYADNHASAAGLAQKTGLQTLQFSALASPLHAVHVAIGENSVRQSVTKKHGDLRWAEPVVHPSAVLLDDIDIGEGSFVSASAIVQTGARIGRHVIINTGAIIEHDCVIGDFCHVGPGAVLSGHVSLGEGVLIGAGATVLKGRKVGAWTKVGAGSAVVRDLFGAETAFGVPARPHRMQNDK